jgi:Gram-negative bacterial TonB protein C-terminal
MKKTVVYHAVLIIFMLLCPGNSARCESIDWSRPVLISQPDPDPFPESFKKIPTRGLTVIRASIDQHGQVTQTEVANSNKALLIDAYIMKWISRWKYLPRLKNGNVSAGFTLITVRYDLSENIFDVPEPVNSGYIVPDAILAVLMGNPEFPDKGYTKVVAVPHTKDPIPDTSVVTTIN